MRRYAALAPQTGPLGHAEAVLFVDNGHAEFLKLDVVLYHRMCAYKDMETPVGKLFGYVAPFLGLCRPCEEPYIKAQFRRESAQSLVVLAGKNFRRRHKTCLEAVVDGEEHGHECHESIARPNVALHEPVHLAAAHYVGADFLYYALLGAGEFERQTLIIEIVEPSPYPRHHISLKLGLTAARATQHVDLDEEQFVEFKAQSCRVEVGGR